MNDPGGTHTLDRHWLKFLAPLDPDHDPTRRFFGNLYVALEEHGFANTTKPRDPDVARKFRKAAKKAGRSLRLELSISQIRRIATHARAEGIPFELSHFCHRLSPFRRFTRREGVRYAEYEKGI